MFHKTYQRSIWTRIFIIFQKASKIDLCRKQVINLSRKTWKVDLYTKHLIILLETNFNLYARLVIERHQKSAYTQGMSSFFKKDQILYLYIKHIINLSGKICQWFFEKLQKSTYTQIMTLLFQEAYQISTYTCASSNYFCPSLWLIF